MIWLNNESEFNDLKLSTSDIKARKIIIAFKCPHCGNEVKQQLRNTQ
jgi:predicted RNA-binding Zn-ribbon protein involved in translation (DUF1610 family)